MDPRFDDFLNTIITEKGQGIYGFLDVLFSFLYRRTDFFYEMAPGENMGFFPGQAQAMINGYFKKYQELHYKEKVPKRNIDPKVIDEYLKQKSESLFNAIGTYTELDENNQIFYYISIFSLYMKIYGDYVDKKILIDTWKLLKKVHFVRIVGNTIFEIDKYLISTFHIFQTNKLSLDPKLKDLSSKKRELLDNTRKNLPVIIYNLRLNVMTWITRVESDIYENNINMKAYEQLNEKEKESFITNQNLDRAKFLINGLALANYLNKIILYLLDAHILLEVSFTPSFFKPLIIGLELIKVIQTEFNRLIPLVSINLSLLNRSLLSQVQNILKLSLPKIQGKMIKATSKKLYYQFMNDITRIFLFNCQNSPSFIRRNICKLCYEMMVNKDVGILSENERKIISMTFWKLDIVNELSKQVKHSCDVSYVFFYQSFLEYSFKNIYQEYPRRLYFFIMAVNDMENPLYHIRYVENNGFELIKKHRNIIKKKFEKFFLKPLVEEIESDLRTQVHSIRIKGLNNPNPSINNLAHFLSIENLPLFDVTINIKRYAEEYLNSMFYKMTTLNLNNWQTYQQMRVLAKTKYNLDLHEIFLPSQNLDQGKDILAIIRNFNYFALP